MLRILFTRALLVALPLAVYFVWREVARRSGREMGSTPWAWLVAAGLVLAGGSLMLGVAFHPDNRGRAYVPAEAHPGGDVTPGRFDQAPASPQPSPAAPPSP